MAQDKNVRESVTLQGPDRIAGSPVQAGDSVDVYAFQRRHMVAAGSVAGGLEDIASESEKDALALNVLKRAEDRDDVDEWTVEKTFAENDIAPVEPAAAPAASQQSEERPRAQRAGK